MSAQKKMKKYKRHGDHAVKLFNSGDFRRSADEYLLAFQSSPSKTEQNRWQIFHGYSSILSEKYFPPTSDDVKTLKGIRDNRSEPKLFRVEAGFKCALLNFDMGNRFEAAEDYREAIRIGEKKNKADDISKMMEIKPTPDGQPSIQFTPMAEIAAGIIRECRENLAVLTKETDRDPFEGLFRPPAMRSDGSAMPSDAKMLKMPPTTKLTHAEFNMLIKIGGDVCDRCGKSDVPLSSCARCKASFYCSKECQRKQWKSSHKNYCRKPDEFQGGDHVMLHGIESKPELNGTVVTMVGPTNQPGRLEVKFGEEGKSMSVSKLKLRHIRPLDCVERFRLK